MFQYFCIFGEFWTIRFIFDAQFGKFYDTFSINNFPSSTRLDCGKFNFGNFWNFLWRPTFEANFLILGKFTI